MGRTKIGTYEGTGAALNFSIGFAPDFIEVINAEDGDSKWTWFRGMAAASAIFEQNVVDNGTTGNASMALDTTNGITAYDGTKTAGEGFTVGTDLSENGKTYRYLAIAGDDY